MKSDGVFESQTLADRVLAAGRRALASLAGEPLVRRALTARPTRARRFLAIGKAAWSMAAGCGLPDGLVVTKDAPPIALPPGVELLRSDHPRPGARSVDATQRALAYVRALPADEELLVLLSGGTSALLGGPVDGITLDEIASLTSALLDDGQPIHEINRMRRRLGAALGGRLACATRASLRALVISDVAGDDLRVIGSGPLWAPPADDATRAAELAASLGVSADLQRRIAIAAPSPSELAASMPPVDAQILAGPEALADAAARRLAGEGLSVRSATALAKGPVEDLVERLCAEAERLTRGAAFVMAGEPTVSLGRDSGKGGRAQHAALLLAERLRGRRELVALALASDGTDGPTDAAGAIVTGLTAKTTSLAAAIARYDAYPALEALGALVHTGATGTNLTDLYVIARA